MSEDLLTLEVGPVAHGGSCVARHDGRVVFVRHALPGELVRARVEDPQDGDRFWRADAVEVLRASPDRVEPRCPVSGPGGCGGCDWQHASADAQRRLKAQVVLEQLRRLGKVDVDALGLADLAVEPVPGDHDGLGWRTRVRFAVDPSGRPGLRRHRSHDVVPVEVCPIAHEQVNAVGVGRGRWRGAASVEVVAAPAGQDPLVLVEPAGPKRVDVPPLATEAAVARRDEQGLTRVRGRTWVEEQAGGRRFRVTGGGFWQVHPGAAQTLLDAVLDAAQPRQGERAVDLYSGVGLFSAALAERVGEQGAVLGVESDERANADARRSLHDLPQVSLVRGRVERVLPEVTAAAPWDGGADVVVLDPPRSGAGRGVVEAITALGPRVVVYVACDPAALARDVATAAGLRYRLAGLRAFDCFPLTHHVECVATLVPA